MSLVPKSLRIIAVPLTRPRLATPANAVQASRILTYYQFQISPTQPTERLPSSQESKLRWMPEGGLGKWITTKAAVTWAGFGKSKGWKLKIFQGGERLVDRLDFEELALKSIDPSLGPSITQTDMSHKRTEEIKTRHEVLLTRDAVPAILELFGLKPSASADLLRAVEQARVRVLSGRGVL
ncbi:hypothetical protein H0H81_012109 [Sphagnurus paluster]|uniref:Uncharacterized protein n=1 Tax=Sphagnurus paluster TaxID=117069 RepID=A0A9P7GI52_9AGAR|nr:hypothetical protein H0H81_012109 [Sphagnurus paluster]